MSKLSPNLYLEVSQKTSLLGTSFTANQDGLAASPEIMKSDALKSAEADLHQLGSDMNQIKYAVMEMANAHRQGDAGEYQYRQAFAQRIDDAVAEFNDQWRGLQQRIARMSPEEREQLDVADIYETKLEYMDEMMQRIESYLDLEGIPDAQRQAMQSYYDRIAQNYEELKGRFDYYESRYDNARDADNQARMQVEMSADASRGTAMDQVEDDLAMDLSNLYRMHNAIDRFVDDYIQNGPGDDATKQEHGGHMADQLDQWREKFEEVKDIMNNLKDAGEYETEQLFRQLDLNFRDMQHHLNNMAEFAGFEWVPQPYRDDLQDRFDQIRDQFDQYHMQFQQHVDQYHQLKSGYAGKDHDPGSGGGTVPGAPVMT